MTSKTDDSANLRRKFDRRDKIIAELQQDNAMLRDQVTVLRATVKLIKDTVDTIAESELR